MTAPVVLGGLTLEPSLLQQLSAVDGSIKDNLFIKAIVAADHGRYRLQVALVWALLLRVAGVVVSAPPFSDPLCS